MKDRLTKIINLSYEILCNDIVSGRVHVQNEASLQMQLGVILKQIGQLFEFGNEDRFRIDLEVPQEVELAAKSGTNRARCDINLKLSDGKESVSAAIELKYLRKSGANEAVTDNRYSVMLDLANLEAYQKENTDLNCYEIVYTNNENYTRDNRSKIKLSGNISGEISYTEKKHLTLKGNYKADWDCYDGHYFLKINF